MSLSDQILMRIIQNNQWAFFYDHCLLLDKIQATTDLYYQNNPAYNLTNTPTNKQTRKQSYLHTLAIEGVSGVFYWGAIYLRPI